MDWTSRLSRLAGVYIGKRNDDGRADKGQPFVESNYWTASIGYGSKIVCEVMGYRALG